MKRILLFLFLILFLYPVTGSAQFINSLKLQYQNPGVNNDILVIAEITLPSTPGGPRLQYAAIVTGDTLFMSACYTSGPFTALSQITDTIRLGGPLPPGIRGVHFRSYYSFNSSSCDSTSGSKKIVPFLIGSPTGGRKSEISTLEIYPNPVQDELVVSGVPISQLYLYSLHGRLLKRYAFIEKISVQVRVAELPAGIYILEIKNKTGAVYRKQLLKS